MFKLLRHLATESSTQDKLVGKWGVTTDEDNRFVFTFAADGTFEILATDPETPHRVKAEVSGTYKVDFSVTPAHLNLDATIRKPKNEKPVKHTFKMIVQIIDPNNIRISDMELPQRPKEFGKNSQVLQRQTTPGADADAQSPQSEESQGNVKTSKGRISVALSAEDTSEIFPIVLKLTITNKSDKALPVASLMQPSVLKFDGQDYSLHKLFHNRWDDMAAIPPGKKLVVKSYSTWYGIRDFGLLGFQSSRQNRLAGQTRRRRPYDRHTFRRRSIKFCSCQDSRG